MKKVLGCLALLFLLTAPLLAQGPGPEPDVVLPLPASIALTALQILAIGKTVMELVNGLKDWIPGIEGNTWLLRSITFGSNFIANAGACFILGHVQGAFDVFKCLGIAVVGALVTSGMYKSKRDSDISRAAPTVAAFKAETEGNGKK